MKVKHAVITSVDRDDLSDGGSEIWVSTVKAIRRQSPSTTLEISFLTSLEIGKTYKI